MQQPSKDDLLAHCDYLLMTFTIDSFIVAARSYVRGRRRNLLNFVTNWSGLDLNLIEEITFKSVACSFYRSIFTIDSSIVVTRSYILGRRRNLVQFETEGLANNLLAPALAPLQAPSFGHP